MTILLCVSVLLAGCVTSPILSNCAGWQVATMKSTTYDYLEKNDLDFLLATISNNENGLDSGCWK